jgi:carbon monoxide dehydrogenase subunit G
MIRHAVEIRVERPVEDVFAFLTDSKNHPKWDDSSGSMKPDQGGPWHAGLTFHEVRRMGPRRMEIQSRLSALVPNESMDIDSITGPEFHGHWRPAPDGSGTTLRWSCEMGVDGPARLAEPMIARSFRKACDKSFGQRKRLLE